MDNSYVHPETSLQRHPIRIPWKPGPWVTIGEYRTSIGRPLW